MKYSDIKTKDDLPKIPMFADLTQVFDDKILDTPEIRVWCHPHYVKKKGDDWYETFDSFKEAFEFIKTHKEAEGQPLIAYGGYEINIFDIEKLEPEKLESLTK